MTQNNPLLRPNGQGSLLRAVWSALWSVSDGIAKHTANGSSNPQISKHHSRIINQNKKVGGGRLEIYHKAHTEI